MARSNLGSGAWRAVHCEAKSDGAEAAKRRGNWRHEQPAFALQTDSREEDLQL
jgi:hypothetical protein